MGWKLSKIVRNGVYNVNGVNLFDSKWDVQGQVELKDVAHAMRRSFDVCTAQANGTQVSFAVCEIANGMHMFYLPDGK